MARRPTTANGNAHRAHQPEDPPTRSGRRRLTPLWSKPRTSTACSTAWKCARFGSERSEVRILSRRPIHAGVQERTKVATLGGLTTLPRPKLHHRRPLNWGSSDCKAEGAVRFRTVSQGAEGVMAAQNSPVLSFRLWCSLLPRRPMGACPRWPLGAGWFDSICEGLSYDGGSSNW